jgi:hypothetical protein
MEVIVAILVLTTIVIIGFFWSKIEPFILNKLPEVQSKPPLVKPYFDRLVLFDSFNKVNSN